MEAGAVRRGLVFALLFGGAMGVLGWLAGGFGADAPGAGGTPPETAAQPGPIAPMAGGLGVGESEDANLRQDKVKVVGGKALRYRPWTASWKKAAPAPSQDPDVAVQDVEQLKIVLYPEPTETSQGAVKEGGPGTTRISSRHGLVSHQKDVRTTARLTGDVVLQHFDEKGDDVTLRTQLLDCAIETPADARAETRRATSTESVSVDGNRAHIEGTGLDADLTGTASRITLLSKVKGRFDADGGFTATGGTPNGDRIPVEITCTGACELISLDDRARATDRRWRATFRDRVHVVQGGSSLDCDLLEVEFRANAPKEKGRIPGDRIVASGHVSAKGLNATRTFDMTCDKATRTREGNVGSESDVVVFEGHPVMNVHGRIGTVGAPGTAPAAGANERLEITCDDPVTMRTQRTGSLPTSLTRTNVVFEKNVVARQWEDEAKDAPTMVLRAPRATLYGTQLPGERFQPDTLTSEGGVDITHPDFTSHSDTATWGRVTKFGINRYLLAGKPTVLYTGIVPLATFGAPKQPSGNSKFTLTCDDNVKIDIYEERPDAPGQPPRPYAMLSAGPRVVMVQYAGDSEVSRLTSDTLEATIAKGRQLQSVKAQGGAHVWGAGDEGRQRDVYGSTILLDQAVLPPGADPKAPRGAIVTARGEGTTPAIAITREADGRRNDVRAAVLKYDAVGSLLTATGNVEANLSGRPKDEKQEPGRPAITPGAVKITAAEAQIRFAPSSGKSGEKQELRTMTATGDVVIDGGTSRATGNEATYDAVTGIAELRGQGTTETAQVRSTAESTRFASTLMSNRIQVFFDTSDDPEKSGQIVQAKCPGGGRIIRYFDPPGADGKPAEGTVPRQMQIQCAGPIEMTRTDATMTGDVAAQMKAMTPSGDFTDTLGTIYCDHARLTFDPPETKGTAKDHIRTLEATGANGRQVIAETPEIRCYADRIDVDYRASTMHFSTHSEKEVWLRKLTPGGEQSLFESGTFNYLTKEWSNQLRWRAVQEEGR